MSVLATSRKPSATPQTGRDARLAARAGTFKGQTAGVAPGYVQGNLAILPANLAGDFLRFCQLNPKPCPLLASSGPGDPRLPTLAEDLDIRTDLPRYRVFRCGEVVVSMRPMKPADAIRAIQITTRFPAVHGAPVHIGKPELIGIKDITKP